MQIDNKAFAKAVALREAIVFWFAKVHEHSIFVKSFGRQRFQTALSKAPKRKQCI